MQTDISPILKALGGQYPSLCLDELVKKIHKLPSNLVVNLEDEFTTINWKVEATGNKISVIICLQHPTFHLTTFYVNGRKLNQYSGEPPIDEINSFLDQPC